MPANTAEYNSAFSDLFCGSFSTPTSQLHYPHVDGNTRQNAGSFLRMSAPHYHNCYEIYMLFSGKGRVFIENTCLDLTPGTVVMIKPYVPHRYAYFSANTPNLRFVFNVHPRYLSRFYSESTVKRFFAPFENKCFVHLTDKETRKYLEMAYELDAEFAKPDHGNSFLPIGDILSILARHSESDGTAKKTASADSLLNRMIEYINTHFAEPITLDTLEKNFYIGKRSINELFKRELGTTPGAFLTDLRIQNALFLLTRSDFSYRSISKLCGFTSPSHFYQAFTARMNASPSEFRKKFKEEVLSP